MIMNNLNVNHEQINYRSQDYLPNAHYNKYFHDSNFILGSTQRRRHKFYLN
jgi:hypothetical protein